MTADSALLNAVFNTNLVFCILYELTHRPIAADSTLLIAAPAHVAGNIILHLIAAVCHALVAGLESLVLAVEAHAGPRTPAAVL